VTRLDTSILLYRLQYQVVVSRETSAGIPMGVGDKGRGGRQVILVVDDSLIKLLFMFSYYGKGVIVIENRVTYYKIMRLVLICVFKFFKINFK
jgi:hypothetical protein